MAAVAAWGWLRPRPDPPTAIVFADSADERGTWQLLLKEQDNASSVTHELRKSLNCLRQHLRRGPGDAGWAATRTRLASNGRGAAHQANGGPLLRPS
jgi:hypothetical protein